MKKKASNKKVSVKKASKSQNASSQSNNSTLIVKIIAILGYIGAGFGILLSLILLFGGSFLLGMLPLEELSVPFGALAGAFIVVFSVVVLLFSIFWIFVSRALWNHKDWARIVFIVFTAIGFVSALFGLPSTILSLIVDGAIVYFLGFNKDVRELFK